MSPHAFDVALCDVTAKNVAFSFSLAGHPWKTLLYDDGICNKKGPTHANSKSQ